MRMTELKERPMNRYPANTSPSKAWHENILWNLALITAGSLVCAWAINGILVPHRFLSGGVTGLALILHYLFPPLSVGGTDILSIILLQRYSIRIGSTVLFFNASILILSTFLFDLESVLYTLIFMFVSSRLVDLVVTGFSQRKAMLIISAHWEAIAEMIVKKMNRGVTLVPAEGGYRHEQGRILYTVVTTSDLPQLKNYIRQIDPNPFVVVTNTLEVIGQRIGNQPHW